MRRGQTAILALFSVGVLLLGIVLVAPHANAFFSSMNSDDSLFNYVLTYIWVFILAAAVFAFFTYMAVVRAQ